MKGVVSLVVLLLASVGCVVSSKNFVRVDLTTVNPDAVCNDGTPAIAFYRAGSGSGASIWTIYLEGGAWCYDKPSCDARYKQSRHYMTSSLLPAVFNDTTVGGINSGDPNINPYLYNSNQVYLWYCSSDIYSGNISKQDSGLGYHFRGKVIVETLINYVAQQQSIKDAKTILLTGCSAGAEGTFANADFVGDMFKSIAPNAAYKVYADSVWQQDMPEYNRNTKPTRRYGMQNIAKNFKGRFNDACDSAYAPSGQQWRCAFAPYSYPFIKSNFFIMGYHYDGPFLNDVPFPFPNDTAHEYGVVLKRAFLMETQDLPNVFEPACHCHCNAPFSDRWNHIQIDGVTAAQAVWKWMTSSDSSYTQRFVDTCLKPNCNPTCPKC